MGKDKADTNREKNGAVSAPEGSSAPNPSPSPTHMGAHVMRDGQALRKGWTTGACATAATKAALGALLNGYFEDPVTITLPGGQQPAFALAREEHGGDFASATIIKDAGDDPDVTHGAAISAHVRFGEKGAGIRFFAGEGVGHITRPGLPLAIGEPAINPVPRAMMTREVEALMEVRQKSADIDITISVENGAAIAQKTWNPRLGIEGGLSILGTTGIVNPFSCAAWIHSIHRGVDVARAMGLNHILGATGSTSENAAQSLYHLPQEALIDMGDFAGGLLKYLRQYPVPRLTIAGGFAKITKLAQGALDLHSSRSQIDNLFLLSNFPKPLLNQNINNRIQNANTALEVLEISQEIGFDLPKSIALNALATAKACLKGAKVEVDIVITDRRGTILARSV